MVMPLFTSHFFRESIVCVRYGINYAQKQRLGGKKKRFCSTQCPKQNETIQKKKSERYEEDCLFEFWRALVTAREARCDAPVIWWGRNLAIGFLDK